MLFRTEFRQLLNSCAELAHFPGQTHGNHQYLHPPPPTLDNTASMSQQALNKIAPNSPSRQKPSEIESNIATALHELETNIPDMRGALRPLQFVSAREVR